MNSDFLCPPVLLIIFNRPNTTEKMLKSLKLAKPGKIYVAADGPRDYVSSDEGACRATRNLLATIDWECEIHTQFQSVNLGCKKAVVTALDWFFKNEEQGLIIEDDIIPHPSFYHFCSYGLEKYRGDSRILSIQGFNQFGQGTKSNKYYYSRGFYAWGWATWADRWSKYRMDISKTDQRTLLESPNYPKHALKTIATSLELVRHGLLDTWDYQMLYLQVVSGCFNVVPCANLTTNIGADGAHSIGNNNIFHQYGSISIDDLEPLNGVSDNEEYNKQLFEEFSRARPMMVIKEILLHLGLYATVRRLFRKFKG